LASSVAAKLSLPEIAKTSKKAPIGAARLNPRYDEIQWHSADSTRGLGLFFHTRQISALPLALSIKI
jgi:hypothetical protein